MSKRIADEIVKISGKYSPQIIFSDWVKMLAIAISNACEIDMELFEKREREYLDIAQKYNKDELMKFSKMSAILAEETENNITDVLGETYM